MITLNDSISIVSCDEMSSNQKMMPWINYHHLYYFKTIAEEGSVSRAAAKLRLGQPTLSAQLKIFEGCLGVQLFDRRHKKLILTEQGQIALDYARGIFQMGSEMVEALHDRLRPTKPSLHIGALDGISKQIIVQLAQRAYRLSKCQITLSEGKSDELLRELQAHRFDILVTNFLPTGASAKGLYPKPITKKQVSLYGRSKFKALKKGFPASISDQPVILPSYESKLRLDIDHWTKLNHVNPDIVCESQDIAVKKLLAVNGVGLIAAASHTVTGQVLAGELMEIGPMKGVFEELFLITARRRIENPLASKLVASFEV